MKPTSRDKELLMQKIINAKERREDVLANHSEQDWGSDEDEVYYDADNDEDEPKSYLNNQVCGTFSKWKMRSCLPLSDFMRRLRRNQDPTTTIVQVEKSQYERQIQELKEAARQKELAKRQLKRQ